MINIIRKKEKKFVENAALRCDFIVPSQISNGRLAIYRMKIKDENGGAELHYHKNMTEIFTVIEGQFTFNLIEEEFILNPGDSISISPLMVHGFKSNHKNSVMDLVFDNCLNREEFFEMIEQASSGKTTASPEEIEAFFNQHDQYTYK